jgi:hypothetical protein
MYRNIVLLLVLSFAVASTACFENLFQDVTGPTSTPESSPPAGWKQPYTSHNGVTLSQACPGYNENTYRAEFDRNKNGKDVQLHTFCANAWNLYWMYLNAKNQGYTPTSANVTWEEHKKASIAALDFYRTRRA